MNKIIITIFAYDTGADLVSLPPFPCVEDYRIVKEKLYSFWRDKG